ncbi:MAG: alpha/beta hydrolase [Bacteroidia bacterium]|nr:alpha/beta hydrolase [Bacteroidia bacterium]
MAKAKLILLHGALGSKKQFEPLKDLLKNEFDLYDLNFEGHGGKPFQHPYSIDAFTNNLKTFVEEEKLSHVDIFGYSMGGYVALNFSFKNPSWLGKIITLGTKFDWSPEAAEKEIKMLNPEKIEEKVPGFAEKLRKEHAPLDWKEVVRNTASMMREMGAGAKLEMGDFEKIATQVSLGLGENDKMVSLEETRSLAEKLPNGKIVRLKDVPHPIEKVDPQILATFIREQLH